jgi:Tol biopolymer transport system component
MSKPPFAIIWMLCLASCSVPAADTAPIPFSVVSTPSPARTDLVFPTVALTETAAGGRIIFETNRDGNLEIYGMDADGSHLANLTNNPGYDGEPSWSPDGKRIAFESDRDGDTEIFLMDADGSNPVRLTYDPGERDGSPVWSPDGRRIAFISTRGGKHAPDAYVYVMDADGSRVARLTDDTVVNCPPSWSPDGDRLVYCSYNHNPANIGVAYADGSGSLLLTNDELDISDPPWNLDPAWSRDGKRIVFRSNREDPFSAACDSSVNGCNYELYTIDPDGSNEIRLSFTPENERGPVWSPDGMHAAFFACRGGECDIRVVDVDRLETAVLTNSAGNNWDPAWSPEGRRIAFYSDRDGNEEIYVMNADGSGLLRLTDNPADDYDPVWLP